MTTYELISDLLLLDDLFENDQTFKQLRDVVKKAPYLGREVVKDVLSARNTDAAWALRQRSYREIEGFTKAVRQFPLRETILKLNELYNNVLALISSFESPIGAALHRVPESLQEVIDKYESFIMNPTGTNAFDLLTAVEQFDNILDGFYQVLAITHTLFSPRIEIEGNAELSIYFSWTKEYRQFIDKLVSINNLYAELCSLLGVSTAEYPLRWIRAEYGSLWIRIFGESKVIALLTSLIDSAVSYLHRNFTNEGKIISIPKKLNAIEEVLRLTEKLEAHGIDTHAIKENLQKSAIVVSQELNTLLASEPNITVNDKKYSVGKDIEEKFLKESRGLFLKGSDDGDEPVKETPSSD